MKKGFTLIELLVVIGIIVILSSVIMASFSSRNYSEDANYKIESNGHIYYVESYTKENEGNCVYMSEHEARECGDWSVTKLVE